MAQLIETADRRIVVIEPGDLVIRRDANDGGFRLQLERTDHTVTDDQDRIHATLEQAIDAARTAIL